MKIWDWVFIIGSNRINQDYFNKHFPRGWFGKIIEIKKRFSSSDGHRFPNEILVRVYLRNGRSHLKTTAKFIKPI
jgi:hypothetical protein